MGPALAVFVGILALMSVITAAAAWSHTRFGGISESVLEVTATLGVVVIASAAILGVVTALVMGMGKAFSVAEHHLKTRKDDDSYVALAATLFAVPVGAIVSQWSDNRWLGLGLGLVFAFVEWYIAKRFKNHPGRTVLAFLVLISGGVALSFVLPTSDGIQTWMRDMTPIQWTAAAAVVIGLAGTAGLVICVERARGKQRTVSGYLADKWHGVIG